MDGYHRNNVRWRMGKPSGLGLWLVVKKDDSIEAAEVKYHKGDGDFSYMEIMFGSKGYDLRDYTDAKECFGPVQRR